MSGRTLAILFVVLLLVAAAAILVNQRAPAPEPTPEIPPTPERVQFLEGATIESVTRLDVRDNLNDDFASFFRDGQGLWYQTNPTSTLVISQTMNSQVTGLLNMTSQRTLGADENPLSAYGLDNPAYTVVLALQGEDGQVTRVLFLVGNETPAGTGYYLQKKATPRLHRAHLQPEQPHQPVDHPSGAHADRHCAHRRQRPGQRHHHPHHHRPLTATLP